MSGFSNDALPASSAPRLTAVPGFVRHQPSFDSTTQMPGTSSSSVNPNLGHGKKKKKKKPKIALRRKIKPKAKTEEEAKREAEVIKTRQDCYEEQLRMTMDAITNPPPDELEEGTIVEVLSEDFKGGFGGVRYCAKVLKVRADDDTLRRYHVEYVDWEEDDAAENLKEWIDSKFIRPVPPVKALVEYVRGDQVDVVIDAVEDGGWWPGVVLRNNGEEGYDVRLYTDGSTIMVMRAEDIRLHVDWTGSRDEHNMKRGNGGWEFICAPSKELGIDEQTNGIANTQWDSLIDKKRKGDASDEDVDSDDMKAEESDSDWGQDSVNEDSDGDDFIGKNDTEYDNDLMNDDDEYEHSAKRKQKRKESKKRKLANLLVHGGNKRKLVKRRKKGGIVKIVDSFRKKQRW